MFHRHAHRPLPGRRSQGFSLLELMAVVAILGILAAIVMPRIVGHTHFAKGNVCRQYRADLDSAVERYFFDYGAFPKTVNALHPEYYPADIPKCPIDQSDYVIDAVTGRITGHEH